MVEFNVVTSDESQCPQRPDGMDAEHQAAFDGLCAARLFAQREWQLAYQDSVPTTPRRNMTLEGDNGYEVFDATWSDPTDPETVRIKVRLARVGDGFAYLESAAFPGGTKLFRYAFWDDERLQQEFPGVEFEERMVWRPSDQSLNPFFTFLAGRSQDSETANVFIRIDGRRFEGLGEAEEA